MQARSASGRAAAFNGAAVPVPLKRSAACGRRNAVAVRANLGVPPPPQNSGAAKLLASVQVAQLAAVVAPSAGTLGARRTGRRREARAQRAVGGC